MGLRIQIFLLLISIQFLVATALTNASDLAALGALKDAWTNIPNWDGHDPCGSSWVGIQCNNSRITSIILPSMGLIGQLTGDIGQLSELQILDLSFNGLTGPLTPSIGSLTKLTYLALVGCGFSGPIPDTIGSLQQLYYLDLNSNSFSGSIPPSIGNLSNLYVLDLTNNSLSGTIPVSSGTTPGLDKLLNTKHFHFGNNQLSGAIPSSLFSSSMTLIHVLFQNNQFNGSIPSTLALVQKLEVVRLDGNSLTGSVPSQFSNLTSVNELDLSNNQLSGPFPNLSTMKYLNYVDLSNNTFDASVFPSWLSNLQSLTTMNLSYNSGLTGSLPPSIGNLTKLTTLALESCGFYGPIPGTIGYMQQLRFLHLSSNSFSESIPSSIGNLSNLYWLDLSVNNLSGPIPVSSGTTPGLDMLVNTKHFHFGNNQLSGAIPSSLFNSNMTLIHVLFENNQLNGSIPSTLALVQKLEVVRLDGNSLTGSVPSQFNNLINVNVLYLSNNRLSGPFPNLSTMNYLDSIDLSNNTFDASVFPSWLSNLPSLTTIVMENTRLYGSLPNALFNLPQLQTVSLSNNQLNGTLDVRSSYGNQLELVDLQNNSISDINFTETVGTIVEFILVGNPACTGTGGTKTYCVIPPSNSSSYSTPPNNCIRHRCSSNKVSSPNCICAYPYTGTLIFRAPSFSDLGNSTIYTALESSLMDCFQSNQLPVDSVSLSKPTKNTDNNLLISLEVFPYGQDHFDRTRISGISLVFSNHTFVPPSIYGPYSFRAYDYFEGNKSSNRGVITGAAVGGSVVLLLALLAGFYAFRQKRRAEKADRVNNPFASWNPNTTRGGVPLLQGTKCFSYDELKKYTNNFAEANRIGSGGYGKVYRGTLPSGLLVAIKRAQRGSLQGGLEFKTEIELLSRVHHKNVVCLTGFCFERAEEMLVYEYIANGTLHESLSGKIGIRLNWMRRLRIALGAARGLQYLHELANPPIIHRDIKSSNILLDESLNAKVSDFGLSKPMGDAEKSHISTQVKGTMGYMDPEYYMTQQLTEKSDVYSFGVVLLELVTARQPIEKGKYIVREVRQRMKRDQVLYSLDEILDPVILTPAPKGLEQFVDLAMTCVEEEGARRPAMGAVVKEIENVMQIAGLNPNADSTSTSATHEGDGKGYNHPYTDDSLFVSYSGTFPLTSN